MGKGGSILGIIGILLGAGGLGFGFIAWSTQNSMQANLAAQNIWSQYDGDSFTVNPAYTYLHIPNMSIAFDLPATASIHILFTCSAVIFPAPSVSSVISFFFKVDGVQLTAPRVDVGSTDGGSIVDYFSIVFQHFIPSFSSGAHNISVMVFSGVTTNYVRYCSLTIQSVAD